MRRRVFKPTKPDGPDSAVGGSLDSLGKGDGRTLGTLENGMKMAVISTKLKRQSHDVGDFGPKIDHVQSMGISPIQCNTLRYGLFSHRPDTNDMDIWSHRDQFKVAVKQHRETAGLKIAQVAESIGIKEQTLKDYLYRKDVKPSLEVLQKAATVFRCSVTEFLDDPGAVPAEVDPNEWSETTERDRVLATAMLADLRSIPEAEKDIYYQLWKQGIAIGRARRASEETEEKAKAKESRSGKKP